VVERVGPLLERVGLADRGAEPIARFSKGMIQRLGLAQALINDPELLVLDEPTEGLDLTGRQLLREIVREFRQRGRTVLLISHVLNEIEFLCDRLVVLVQGQVIKSATPGELCKDAPSLEQALANLYSGGQP
jgi:ABC-2 type transport system ATP-binding protein